MKYNIAICDDEDMMIKINTVYITELSKKMKLDVSVHGFTDGRDLIDFAYEHKIDIAFLDIDMPEISGISSAMSLKKINKDIIIIFVTGHKEFALEAFDADAVGYIVKPVQPEKLERILRKAINLINMSKNQIISKSIFIIEDNVKKKLLIHQIISIEKEGNRCKIVSINETHYCYMTISKILNELDKDFWQINQGVVVGKRYIKDIYGNEVIMKNGQRYVLGRKYSKDVKDRFYNQYK